MTDITIRPARPSECAEVGLFLKRHELAIDDIDPALQGFYVARKNDELVGTVGIEQVGNVGLLRSLAVSQSNRGYGLGQQLYRKAIQHAVAAGIRKLYLLTTTADTFFARNGFKHISRTTVPEEIQRTEQYSRICPESAIIMQKSL